MVISTCIVKKNSEIIEENKVKQAIYRKDKLDKSKLLKENILFNLFKYIIVLTLFIQISSEYNISLTIKKSNNYEKILNLEPFNNLEPSAIILENIPTTDKNQSTTENYLKFLCDFDECNITLSWESLSITNSANSNIVQYVSRQRCCTNRTSKETLL